MSDIAPEKSVRISSELTCISVMRISIAANGDAPDSRELRQPVMPFCYDHGTLHLLNFWNQTMFPQYIILNRNESC
jgi:hypothetical protein